MAFAAFAILAIICAIWGVISSIVITDYLSKRGVKINWIFLRIFLFRYVGRYKTVTVKETGKIGPWYYSIIISMNLVLVFGILAVIIKIM